ncbi:hypothetical protein XENOCAPTIV_029937 [Xenoophorus captivus]|uniref:Uncharacterized protein n=1 Tax=Xenoophorus captivus TaxID=1517983 RepID=A0ABV0R5Q9_9TELE
MRFENTVEGLILHKGLLALCKMLCIQACTALCQKIMNCPGNREGRWHSCNACILQDSEMAWVWPLSRLQEDAPRPHSVSAAVGCEDSVGLNHICARCRQ